MPAAVLRVVGSIRVRCLSHDSGSSTSGSPQRGQKGTVVPGWRIQNARPAGCRPSVDAPAHGVSAANPRFRRSSGCRCRMASSQGAARPREPVTPPPGRRPGAEPVSVVGRPRRRRCQRSRGGVKTLWPGCRRVPRSPHSGRSAAFRPDGRAAPRVHRSDQPDRRQAGAQVVSLFNRTRRGVELSAVGHQPYEEICPAWQQISARGPTCSEVAGGHPQFHVGDDQPAGSLSGGVRDDRSHHRLVALLHGHLRAVELR